MSQGLVTAAYMIAGILFIMSLAGLSKQETAKRGNYFGILGMAIALVTTIVSIELDVESMAYILVAVLIGAIIGILLAKRVDMTEMPELIAALHSFVGLAAVFVGYNSFIELLSDHSFVGSMLIIHLTEIFLGIFIGAVTFTGSIVAFGKLHGKIRSNPLILPYKDLLNIGLVLVSAVLIFLFIFAGASQSGIVYLAIMTAIALFLGWHMVMAIGGADMPVVISMLNSLSGWAAAASGFMLSNDLLIITGALVGSSGAILSYIMCQGMNRNFFSVITGGFGNEGASGEAEEMGDYREISPEDAADMLKGSSSVIITPGYGMAVAQAQYPVAEITKNSAIKGSMSVLVFIRWQGGFRVI